MENDILKQAALIMRENNGDTANRYKYRLQDLCRYLSVSRQYFYYLCKDKPVKVATQLRRKIEMMFKQSLGVYGTRSLQ